MVLVGLDYGRKRTGLAVFVEGMVLPREFIKGTWTNIITRLESMQQEFEKIEIVLGLPLSALGKSTELSLEVELFAEKLKSIGFCVHLVNENRSSIVAKQLIGKKDRKGRIDSVAACEILKRYLNIYE